MIASLTIENFRCWRSLQRLRLAPITGLFGPNSSGKSALLELLLLLKHTVESSERSVPLGLDGHELANAPKGSFLDLVHGRSPRALLAWELAWTLPRDLGILGPVGAAPPVDPHPRLGAGNGAWDVASPEEAVGGNAEATGPSGDQGRLGRVREVAVRCEVHARTRGHALAVRRLRYEVRGLCVGLVELDGRGGYELEVEPPGAFGLEPWAQAHEPLPAPFKGYGFPDELAVRYRGASALLDLPLAYERLMKGLSYLGPCREAPPREARPLGGEPGTVGASGERTVEVLLGLRARGEPIPVGRGRRGLAPEEWLSAKLSELGLARSLVVAELSKASPLYQVRLRTDPRSPEVALPDAGLGVWQVLPLLVLLASVPARSTVLLEHPDAHLHPAVQARLADVVIEVVRARRLQVVLESHSEHLLQRLLRRVADGVLSPSDVALYRCRLGDDGAAEAAPLELNELGYVTNWPEEFFGDPLGDALAIAEAAARRKPRAVRARLRRNGAS